MNCLDQMNVVPDTRGRKDRYEQKQSYLEARAEELVKVVSDVPRIKGGMDVNVELARRRRGVLGDGRLGDGGTEGDGRRQSQQVICTF